MMNGTKKERVLLLSKRFFFLKASSTKEEKRYVYGLAGIARLFGCSYKFLSK